MQSPSSHAHSGENATQVMPMDEIAEAVADGIKASRKRRRGDAFTRTTARVHSFFFPSVFSLRTAVKRGAATAVVFAVATLSASSIAAQANSSLSQSLTAGLSTAQSTPHALSGSQAADSSSAARLFHDDPSLAMCLPHAATSTLAPYAHASDTVVMPLDEGVYTITSGFGERDDPITGNPTVHIGVDFAAPLDTHYRAIADGTVLNAGKIDGYGDVAILVIQHEIDGHSYQSWYIHSYDDGLLVKVGDKVKAGQEVGKVGNAGHSTGPHLHLEIHDAEKGDVKKAESAIDPEVFLREHHARDFATLCQ